MKIDVLGVPLSATACERLARADVVVAGTRHLALAAAHQRQVLLHGDLSLALSSIDTALAAGAHVAVLASGDPGWFGIVRVLAERFGPAELVVEPAPSSVSVAFARLGLPWDDAVVVSAHSRALSDAARVAAQHPKVAVLTSPDSPAQALGEALLALGAVHEHAAVCSSLFEPAEIVTVTDLPGLAAGTWDPVSVVVLWSGTGVAGSRSLAWGLPDSAFAHRDSMITKSEVRAVVVGLLDLPPAGVLWDVGTGSGSVAVECARLAPGLDVIAIDRDVSFCRANATAHGVGLRVMEGEAPACLADLPNPDRAMVGGGGLTVLRSTASRLRPGGRLVATYAAIDRAAEAASLLGNMTQVAASRGVRLPDGGWRLAAENPTFVVWGEPCAS